MIVSDALRRDALGLYGGEAATPHLDALGRRGAVFQRAYSISNHTIASMIGMFTSTPPSRLKMKSAYQRFPEIPLLSQRLQKAGYRTAAFLGHMGLRTPELGLTQGFDAVSAVHHRDHLLVLNGREIEYDGIKDPQAEEVLGGRSENRIPDTTRIITRQVGTFLDGVGDDPFYLWVHLMDPHDPYAPPPEWTPPEVRAHPDPRFGSFIDFDGMYAPPPAIRNLYDKIKSGTLGLSASDKSYIKSLYLAEVRYLDACVGNLIERLERNRLLDKTIIVFTADHGEEFWDNGDFAHGQSFADVLVNVPLIICHPEYPGWGTSDFPVSHMDLMPTLFQWLGLEPFPGHYGRSLAAVFDHRKLEARPIFSEEGFFNEDEIMVVYRGRYKALYDTAGGALSSIEGDNYRTYETAPPETVREMRTVCRDYYASNLSLNSKRMKYDQDYIDRTNKILKSLGYVGK